MVAGALILSLPMTLPVQAQRGGGQAAASATGARAAAPIDLTGTWVSVITEDWRWRMMTPPKGDYASVPLNAEARRIADAWDLAKDEAAGLACKPFGVGNLMRMPGRLRIAWQDDMTLKLEFDAGTQTRLLHFSEAQPPAEPTWQGHSVAQWEVAGQAVNLAGGRGPGRAAAPPGPGGGAGRGGSLNVVTTRMREGYLRKNGVPYSGDAVVTEYFDRLGPEPNGDVILLVRTVVDDPKYLQQPFVTSTNFKLEPNDSKWSPSACKIDPPAVFRTP
jgi:hypothetical protein